MATAETKQKVSEILNIPNTKEWEIVSEDPEANLYMAHHSMEADMQYYGTLRGVVVDVENKAIISHSHPHTPKVVANSINIHEGKIFMKDEYNVDYELDPEKINVKMGFEGTLMHVFKHNGKVYRTTRKRLDPSRSRWGNSVCFLQMYWDLGGPTDEVLFSPDKAYSPYCHTFIMVHPDVLVATKDDVGDGYLVYLGPKQMYRTDTECPYDLSDVDIDLHVPETSNDFDDKTTIYQPENLSLEQANKHLLFGFYDGFEGYQYLDPRLLPGEFVIVELLDDDGLVTHVLRVESPSYTWRSVMRNNNPNIKHRFYELVDYSFLKNSRDNRMKYENMFPILTRYQHKDLKKLIDNDMPIMVWPQKTEEQSEFPRNREDKLYNIWQCYLVSIPFHYQKEVVKYLEELAERRTNVINWLFEISVTGIDYSEFSKRAKDILHKTREFAEDKMRKGQNTDQKTGKAKTVDEMTRDNIKNFIHKEKGPSLYRLNKEMVKYSREYLDLHTSE